MKLNQKKNTKKTEHFYGYRSWIAGILTIFFIFFPYITFFHMEFLRGKSIDFFGNENGIVIDFTLYAKEFVLLLFCIFLILFFIGEYIFPDHVLGHSQLKTKPFRFAVICLGGYLFLTLLSGIFSENKEVVLWGSCTEFEGLFALFCYFILFFAGALYLSSSAAFSKFQKGLAISIVLVCILTMIEFFYRPLLEFPFISYLIAPRQYRSIAQSLKNENFQGQAALCFYNPGYLGSFLSLLFPSCLAFCFSSKKRMTKLFWELITVLCMIALYASHSSAAMIVSFLTSLLLLIILRPSMHTLLPALLRISFLLGIMISVSFTTGKIGTPRQQTQETQAQTGQSLFRLSSLSLKDGRLTATSSEKSFTIELLKGKSSTYDDLSITNALHTPIKTKLLPNNHLQFTEDGYEAVELFIQDGLLILKLGYPGTIEFYCTDQGLLAIGQNGTPLTEIPAAPFQGLEWFYGFATGRGYIWLNTLPILKDCLLLGKGTGNFVFYFTQNDIVGLLNTHGSCKFVIDKPHNWYLQIAVSSGLPALIFLILLFLSYLKQGGKKLFSSPKLDPSSTALFLGTVSFLLVGMINDSIVSVSPIFWLLFGISFGRIHSKEQLY